MLENSLYTFNVNIPDSIPFGRIFRINITVLNLKDSTIFLKIVLEEHSGFQAGDEYGDGDEVKDVTLNPRGKISLGFKAKVYGVPRNSEVVIIKVYDDKGKLLQRIERKIYLISQVASIIAVLVG